MCKMLVLEVDTMAEWPSLPWNKINDFLLCVCSARSLSEFNNLVCTHIADLVPHDFPLFCFDTTRDSPDAGEVGSGRKYDSGIAVAGDPNTIADYNRYYRFRVPIQHGYFRGNPVTDFRPFSKTEFVNDFIKPRNIGQLLGGWFRHYTVLIPRCKPARPFSALEQAITQVISPHLENFFDVLSLSTKSRRADVAAGVSWAGLTKRESEIAFLLSQRFSMAEIADRLFISRRTVEKHSQNIHSKLGISRKTQIENYLLGARGSN